MYADKEKMSAAYGSWKSPITADVVSGAEKLLGGFAVDGEGRVIWLEGRPTEAGRSVLVREAADAGDAAEDITPAGFNVRTLVHEYGGGAFTVSGDVVVFSNYEDQRLYKQSIKGGSVDTYLKQLQNLRWQAMSIRGEEEEEVPHGKEIDEMRHFLTGVKEVDEHGMSELGRFCREANLEHLFLSALKISR